MSLVFKTPKSTLNTTTGEGQNIGYGECPECPECPKVELSDVDVKYTENGEYTLTPEGDGFSSVGITVNIDTKAIEDAAYAEGEAAGIITGKAQGVAEQKAKLTSTTITENGTTTREDGWNSVTVNVDVETPYNNGVVAGEAAQKAKLESATFVSNGTYTKEDGYNEVTVNVPSDVNNQTKNVTISSNGTETITADSGYSGLGSVEVTVDVPEKQLTDTLETYTTSGEYTITPPTGYDGFSEVNVSVQIDEQAIYQDGFNSGLDAGIAEQKAKLTSTTISSNDTFTNEDGWNEVIVDVQPNLDVLEVTPSTQSQQFLPESGYDGFSQVEVNAVTSSIDRNIQPENIVDGVTILGVTGAYVPTLEEGTYAPEFIGTTTLEPKTDGFSSVEITVPAQPIGSTNNPFDDIQTVLDTDFEEGCYYDEIASGGIDKTTGYYDAVANGGTVFHIKPYLKNPDYDSELRPEDQPDVPEFIFPEDFDLAGKNIIVGFNKANVSQINNQAKAPLLRIAIIYEFNDCDLFAINSNFKPTTWPFGTLRVTENGSVDPTGYAEIDVEVNPTLQTKSVTPSDRQQVITPDRDYDGLSEVTVSGVTAAIDQNITASNIKDGVTILGVTGTYDPQPSLESKTASYTANGTYTITPSTGYDGMDEVEVTVNVSGGSGTQCPDWSSIGWDCNDVTAVGIDADVAYTVQKMQNDPGPAIVNSYWNGDPDLVYLPAMRIDRQNNMFLNDYSLRYVSSGLYFFAGLDEDWGYTVYGNGDSMFKGCSALRTINLDCTVTGDPNLVIFSSNNMFNGCRSLKSVTLKNLKSNNCTGMFQVCENLTTISLINCSAQPTSVQAMFNGCRKLTSVPQIDTSLCTDFKIMFSNCRSLTTVPVLDLSKATNINSIFGTNSTTGEPELTTLGGFTNLGKAFNGTSITNHILDLRFSPKLTKESIMNVINNLAAPDDTAVTDAQLMLSATSYALLTEEDIAIATAKRWSVVSA